LTITKRLDKALPRLERDACCLLGCGHSEKEKIILMGNSTTIRQLDCSRCKKAWSKWYSQSNWDAQCKRWNGVTAIQLQGEAIDGV